MWKLTSEASPPSEAVVILVLPLSKFSAFLIAATYRPDQHGAIKYGGRGGRRRRREEEEGRSGGRKRSEEEEGGGECPL